MFELIDSENEEIRNKAFEIIIKVINSRLY